MAYDSVSQPWPHPQALPLPHTIIPVGEPGDEARCWGNEYTCRVVVRKLLLDTMSTKKSSGISFSWKCRTARGGGWYRSVGNL